MVGCGGRGGTARRWLAAMAVSASVGVATAATAQITGVGGSLGSPAGGAPAEPDGLHGEASIEALYDSNVLRSGRALAGSNTHPDDFRYSPKVEATYGRDTGRIALGVDGLVGRDIFQYNSYLNRNQYRGGGTLSYRAGASCQLSVNGQYTSRQNGIGGIDDAIADPTAGLPDDVGTVVDNVQAFSTYGANARCGSPAGRLTLSGGYTHTSLSNAAITRKFADSDGDTFNASVGIGILRPGQLSFNGSYSTIVYPGRRAGLPGANVPPQLLDAGVRTYRLGFAFSRPIGTRLSGQIGASFLHAEPSGGVAPYSSPAYNVGLTYNASQRLGFSLNGSRDIIASTSIGSLFRIVDTLLFEAHYDLGRAIKLDANAGLIHNTYKQSFNTVGEPGRLSQTSKTFSLGATYSPRKLYDLQLTVTQTIRDSNPDIFNYNGTRVSLTLAVHI